MPSSTEQAVRRLEAALQTLEHAVEERLSTSAGSDALAEEVQMLSADRAHLAESLDQAQARAAKLETINRDVSERLDSAIETIRAVLAADEEGD
jgi:L-lactate utilization protein LutB